MVEMNREYYPEEVADALLFLSDEHYDDNKESEEYESIREDMINALYHLHAVAENKYNNDYFRVLWNRLHDIAENFECCYYEGVWK